MGQRKLYDIPVVSLRAVRFLLLIGLLVLLPVDFTFASKDCVVDEKCAQHGSPFCRKRDSYSGTKTTTLSGKNCQSWAKQEPHAHDYTELESSGNACRNPDGDIGPWCYTEDSAVRWEYCFESCKDCFNEEKECTTVGSVSCKTPFSYSGTRNTTITGQPCQKWSAQEPNIHRWSEQLAGDENYCRQPDYHKKDGPWCYVDADTKSGANWEYCFSDCSGCTCPDTTTYGLDDDFGEIFSPRNMEGKYCNNLNCNYVIEKPKQGEGVILEFKSLSIERADYLDLFFVKNKEKILVKRLSGNHNNERYVFDDTGYVEMVFHTDSVSTYNGFHAQFTRFAMVDEPCECPLRFMTVDEGKDEAWVSIPDQVRSECENVRCLYYLKTTNESQSVEIKFSDMDLGHGDRLRLFEGNQTRSNLEVRSYNLNSSAPESYVSAGNRLMIAHFNSKLNDTEGFSASITQVQGPCQCQNVTLESESGTFQSPGYPNTYCPNMECYYTLNTPEGTQIELTMDEIESASEGRFTVADSKGNFTYPFFFMYSGDVRIAKHPVMLESNKALIRFKTAGFTNKKGFKASFRAIKPDSENGPCSCKNGAFFILKNVSGTIEQPACGPLDCFYFIQQQVRTTLVNISLEELQLNNDIDRNYVNLLNRRYQDEYPIPSSIHRYSMAANEVGIPKVITTNNGILVHFHTSVAHDAKNMATGFKLRYQWDLKDCGSGPRKVAKGERVTLQSPNFPSNYDNQLQCNWVLTADDGYRVVVEVEEVSTEGCCDHLRLYDGSEANNGKLIQTINGNKRGLTFKGNETKLLLNFATDTSVNQKGWKLVYFSEKLPEEGQSIRLGCVEFSNRIIDLHRRLLWLQTYADFKEDPDELQKRLSNKIKSSDIGQLRNYTPVRNPTAPNCDQKAFDELKSENEFVLSRVNDLHNQLTNNGEKAELLADLRAGRVFRDFLASGPPPPPPPPKGRRGRRGGPRPINIQSG